MKLRNKEALSSKSFKDDDGGFIDDDGNDEDDDGDGNDDDDDERCHGIMMLRMLPWML